MSVGPYISGLGHIGLLGWMFWGPVAEAPQDPIEIEPIEVAVISTEIFDIMVNNQQPDVGVVDAALPPPELVIQDNPSFAQVDDAEVDQSTSDAAEAPDEDALPTERPAPLVRPDDVVVIPPIEPEAPVTDETVDAPVQNVERPQLRPVPRVAPQAVAPPPPNIDIADVARDAPATEPAQEAPTVEEQEPAAEEEATTEIVTEEKAGETSAAPLASLRPQLRPERPAPAVPTQSVEEALAAALAEAQEETEAATPPAAPEGATMTSAEVQGLQLAIQRCWNVGALSSDALASRVVIGFQLTQDGRPVPSSLRFVGYEGGTEAGAQQAYEAGRRAILRCGAQGFDLPAEKFALWQNIQMTFNPDRMRAR